MKQAPTGSISLTHFTNIYQRFFPFGDPVPFAGLVFRAFDTNESGAIEFEEYVRVLSVTSRGRMEEKIQCTCGHVLFCLAALIISINYAFRDILIL